MKTLFSLIAIAFLAITANAQSPSTAEPETTNDSIITQAPLPALTLAEVQAEYPRLYTGSKRFPRVNGCDTLSYIVQTIPADKISDLGFQIYEITGVSTQPNDDSTYQLIRYRVSGNENTDEIIELAKKYPARAKSLHISIAIEYMNGKQTGNYSIHSYGGPSDMFTSCK